MKQNPKARLRSRADRLYFQYYLKENCEVCNCQVQQLHHFFSKSIYGHLRYDPDNLISLCNSCHFKLHHHGDPTIQEAIIENRGRKWFNNLKEKAQNTPKDYKINIGYYKDAIKRLEN